MAHFTLTTQQPKPRQLGIGSLSISKNGDADFFEGDAKSDSRILASMQRVKVDWAAAAGIMISGMEPDGFDRQGRPKYKFQEWLLCHLNQSNKTK